MADTYEPSEVIQFIEELALKGLKLSKTQIWILVKCYEHPRTTKSLAHEKGLTYQGMYASVHKLEQMRLLDATVAVGKEWYYRCRFDISETADFTFKLKYKNQTLNMEELIGYLENAANIMRLPHYVAATLCNLYNRSKKREQQDDKKKLPDPTPSEARSFLMQLVAELEDFTLMLRQLADMKLFDPTIRTHELMGEMDTYPNTREVIDYFDGEMIRRWEDKSIGVKGLQGAGKPKEYSKDFYANWKP